jgi:anti-sigma regulatory factor (Ser/Thr protein kinase)
MKSSTEQIRELIERRLKHKGEVRSSEIVKATGLSRTYINRIFQDLQREGIVRLLGKANRARYVRADSDLVDEARAAEITFRRILRNSGLSEDAVLREMKSQTGILLGIPTNVERIVEYGFTEMLNNAIEHSGSTEIIVTAQRTATGISFSVTDKGVGIFNKIRTTRNLASEEEALQDLLKGKLTTDPQRHSGEGIFFTSKSADLLEIKSSTKKIVFDNRVPDIFLREMKRRIGTQVNFWISINSKRELTDIFRQYTGEGFVFDKTLVAVDLFKTGTGCVSRSEARRILAGLENFEHIILDFHNVPAVGQGFIDEIFRVWKTRHPMKTIEVKNADENILFMIQHVQR